MSASSPAEVPVSVIVPLFHPGGHLAGLARTLADQGGPEVVAVIDDGSPPAAIEDALAGVANLQVLETGGSIGTAQARNRGAAAASRPLVTFLDQDDWWDPAFLPALLAGLRGDVLAYDNALWTEGPDGPLAVGETVFERAGWTRGSVERREAALLLDGFPMLKLLLAKETFLGVGGYRQIYAVEDFDLVWRLLAAGQRIDFDTAPGAHYLLHEGSTTERVHRDRRAFERAQRSWLRIWSDMARCAALPAGVRARCLLKTADVAARIPARQVRDRARTAAGASR